jgi:hypothetical protein
VAGLVADRRLRAVADDRVVGQVAAELVAASLHRDPDVLRGRSAGADHLRRDGHGGVGGRLRAADAGELLGRLAAAALDERVGLDGQLDTAGAQVVGDAERELDGHVGGRHAELAARAQAGLGLELRRREALGDQVVAAELCGVDDLDAERTHLVGVEDADRRGAPPVRLHVEERVDDRLGDDVEEVG